MTIWPIKKLMKERTERFKNKVIQMIEWKDSYRLGIDIIDEQHKKLFDIAEDAETIMVMPEHVDRFDEIITILNELRDYVKYHFEQEEKLLLEIQYNKFFDHKVAHNDFIEHINAFNIDEIDEHQTEKCLELVRILIDWLIEHVLEKDKQWAKVYKEKKNM